jgi:hypothetical protein
MARQKGAKKRSLRVVNEHFELLFNAASAVLGINQSFLKCYRLHMPQVQISFLSSRARSSVTAVLGSKPSYNTR